MIGMMRKMLLKSYGYSKYPLQCDKYGPYEAVELLLPRTRTLGSVEEHGEIGTIFPDPKCYITGM